jgi:hypothetical protein
MALPPPPPLPGDATADGGALDGAGAVGNGALGDQPVDFNAPLSFEEMQMMQAMGVPFGFATTAGKHVEDDGANAGAVKVKSTRSARQFM